MSKRLRVLRVEYPELAEQWHPTKNGDLVFDTVKPGSHRKLWWFGDCGHEWDATFSHRATGRGCPFCSGHRVLAGFNDLATTHPELAVEWHPTKNGTLTPQEVSKGSNVHVWWLGECEHEWDATVANRSKSVRSTGCPVCKGKKVLVGLNDLASTHPAIASQWHPTKNGELTPQDVTAGSNKKLFWVCEMGHEWDTTVSKRVSGKGCPVCAGRVVRVGFNDLGFTHPVIASQWHPTKNGELTPQDVTAGTETKLWWVCDKGHEWEAHGYARLRSGCPECAARSKGFVSKGEQEIASWLKEAAPGLEIRETVRTVLRKYEIDIYIPKKKVGIEYNGVYWHSEAGGKTRLYHQVKYEAAKAAGIQLVQIWEDDWNRDPDLVKRVLAHKLGVSTQPVVYARKTRVEALTTAVVRAFLEVNHLQGFASGSYYLGLRDIETEVLVAVMVLKKEPGHMGTLNIIRYATSTRVPGGFTKLLKYAESTYHPSRFITFADHCISDGGLYEQNGFVADKVLPPDYMYAVRDRREHKFGYRLKRFRNDPNLKFVDGLTERELAALNGLVRVWDAGKTRFVRVVG